MGAQPTEKMFREEAIAELMAKKKEEHEERRRREYNVAMIPRRDIEKKLREEPIMAFDESERTTLDEFKNLFVGSQELARDLEQVDKTISELRRNLDDAKRHATDRGAQLVKVTRKFREAIPNLTGLKIYAEPKMNTWHEVSFYDGRDSGQAPTAVLKEYDEIFEVEAAKQKAEMLIIQLEAELTGAQNRKAALEKNLTGNLSRLNEMLPTLTPIYDRIGEFEAEHRAAVNLELAAFDKKIHAEFPEFS